MNEKIAYDTFIEQVALESGYDYDTAKDYVEAMFETIVKESSQGNSVKVRNLGSFQPRWYKAKRGINPQTKEPLDILPHYHIHFASSKELEGLLNAKTVIYKNPLNGVLKRLVVVLLFALIGTLIYRSFFMPDVLIPQKPVKVVPVEKKIVVEPKKESIVIKEVIKKEPVVVIPPKVSESIKKVLSYPFVYTVSKNETLSEIGFKIYMNTKFWPLIFQANRKLITNPDKIMPGQKLTIPATVEGKELHNAYMQVKKAYDTIGNMGKIYWVLCEGANLLDSSFKQMLQKNLHPVEYKIIKRCSSR